MNEDQRWQPMRKPAWGTGVENLDGVWWFDALRPPAKHECTPQTRSRIWGVKIERCACGGRRVFGMRWRRQNSRWRP